MMFNIWKRTETLRVGGEEYKMVLVKGGTFTMVALEGDAYAHEVTLTHDYSYGGTVGVCSTWRT